MATTEEILARALAAGPAERRQLHDEVVVSHLWLADAIARRFSYRGEELDDLVQVARVGLVEACERFSPERGAFLAFAAPTITGVLKRHFRDHGWSIRPPRHAQEVAAEMWSQWPTIVQRLGRIPSGRDLADHLDETPASVAEARRANQAYRASSIDAGRLLGFDVATSETSEEIDRLETRLMLRDVWARLDGAEQQLIQLRFVERRSQSEIAAELGTSQMQVSRLLARLMAKLRALIDASGDLRRVS